MKNFERFFASVWDECNCVVVWAFFGIAFLWDWNEHRPFPVLWPLLSFPNLLAYWVQHFHSIISSWKYPTILKTSLISSSRAKSASFSPLSSFQCVSKVSSYSSIGFNWGCMHAWVLCHFSGMLPPCTVARQAPLFMRFSSQEYWSGLPCSPPGDLPDPGMEPVPLTLPVLANRFFTMSTTWKAVIWGDRWQMPLLWLFSLGRGFTCLVAGFFFFFFDTKHSFSSADFYCRVFPFPLCMRDGNSSFRH